MACPSRYRRKRPRGGVRAEDHRDAIGNVVDLLDKDRALGLERIDHEAVVDDLVPDIDRYAIALDRPLDDLDGPVHPGAEPAGSGDHHAEERTFCGKGRVHVAASSALPPTPLGHLSLIHI